MTTFIVYCSKAGSDPDPRNPSHGRYDLIARSVSSALWLSNSLRNSTIHFYLAPVQKTLTFTNKIKQVSPDERSIIMWIQKILQGRTNPGITLKEQTFQELLAEQKSLCIMDMSGTPVEKASIGSDATFVLGDHLSLPHGLPKAKTISIGPNEYLTNHVIAHLNIVLDSKTGI